MEERGHGTRDEWALVSDPNWPVPWIDGRGALALRAVHELSTAETASLTGRGVIGERPGGAASRLGPGRTIHLPRFGFC